MRKYLWIAGFLVAACGGAPSANGPSANMPSKSAKGVLYPNSVASNDIDYLRHDDPSAFHCLDYDGPATREMIYRGKVSNLAGVQTFVARFTDGSSAEIWVHPGVGDLAVAETLAQQVTRPLGTLPAWMRLPGLVVKINPGDRGAFAEDAGRFIVLSKDNMAVRVANRDIQETVFHEMVHVALDLTHADAAGWRAAQQADGAYLTRYAQQNPRKEDLAETALFAFTYLHYPERLPATSRAAIQTHAAARLEYLRPILSDKDTGRGRVAAPGPCRPAV